jgi:hypothetical protein
MRRWVLRVLAAASALVAVLLAVAVNAATTTLPGFLQHHPARAWILVAVLGALSVGCAVLVVRASESAQQPGAAAKVQVGGVHAGHDLTIEGNHNVVTGGYYRPQTNPDPSKAQGSSQPQRRGER